jgi:enoyl-CoA hydratase/carnithine racemase
VVLTGAGEAFIGGANISKWRPRRAARRPSSRWCTHLRVLARLPVPVIARSTATRSARPEVAGACDLRIASSNAVFGMPEVKVGIPSVVEAALLPGLIGWGRTRELLLFGENIDAATALAWGLVEQVVAPDALDAAVEARLRRCSAPARRPCGCRRS